eukprot:scaffold39541_cov172-Skeletonema_dohrnii-CCMP3373.AAC.1
MKTSTILICSSLAAAFVADASEMQLISKVPCRLLPRMSFIISKRIRLQRRKTSWPTLVIQATPTNSEWICRHLY